MWTKDSTETMHVYRGIHMEKKKLDLVSVASEYKEIKRRQFYQELVVYVVFLTLLFSLLSWLPVQDSFHQNDVVGALTCREEGECEIKTFADIYDFAGKLRDTVCERQDVTAQWVRVGGVGFRQVRVKELRCRVYDGWEAPCYPFYSPEVEQKTPLLGENGTDRLYKWRDGLGELSPEIYRSFVDWLFFAPVSSYGTGGYAVDLCDLEEVEELRLDYFLSEHTRAAAFKFILLNPITRVFTIGMHVITVDPSGHIDHFAHSSHVRVIGHEKPEQFTITEDNGDIPSKPQLHRRIFDAVGSSMSLVREAFDVRVLLWVALVLFFITYCIGEATEMMTMGATTYLGSDMWNLFELTHLVILAALLSYMVHYYMASSTFALHLAELREGRGVEELSHTSSQELLTGFQQLSDLASLGSAISLLKVFKFLRMNATLNLLWRVLGMAMSDLMGFLVIFNLIFLGYSAMGSYAFGFALEEYSTITEVRREALQVMYRFRKCLIDMPSREKEGHNYRPKPVDTSKVELGHLEHLGDVLARNCHDMWALERLKQGWQYGEERDDKKKRHPNLVPYKLLSVEEQAFDYRSSIETIKTIVFMNYTITRANHQRSHSGSFHDSVSRSASMMSDIADGLGGSNSSLISGGSDSTSPRANDAAVFEELGTASHPGTPAKPVPSLLREAMSFRRNSLMGDSPYFTTYGEGNVEVYRPLPIDTTTVELPPRLLRLVDLLAENAHEVWAKGRMDEGWTYGPQRDDSAKKHPCLVPYVFLTDDEKEYDINIAKETLKTLIAMKFTILDRSSKY
ncbi:Serine carboxypeptidase 26 [Phytophthora nicotianae]|uniref:Serine carboxypeptidase 26 n=1 Tax=Phytophthora nicotianae TaxID=4792 RepID=A0A0W8DJZ6_PHYNI|nr:Serine carboxypeptidase 26 [Phytophthora nicotianae]